MKVEDGFRTLRAGWWLAALGVLLGLSAAQVVVTLTPPLYRSSTELFVGAVGSAVTPSAAYSGNLFTEQRVTSYLELIQSQRLSTEVIDELGLSETPEQLAGQVTATVLPNTVILQISVTDTSPQRARAIAASYGRHVIQDVTALEKPDPATPSAVSVSTLDQASYDSTPVSPSTVRDSAFGALLGLLLGVLLVLLRRRTRGTVQTFDDVEAATGTAVLAAVTDDKRLVRQSLADLLDPQAVGVEAFRRLRTRVYPPGDSAPPGIVVVTRARRGEGATTVAAQLATALARAGCKVLLVDADIHRPSLSRRLNLSAAEGLADVLAGTADAPAVIRDCGDGRPAVLPAGAVPEGSGGPSGDPGDLFAAPKMRALLDTLSTAYDAVVIDAPPVLRGGDAGSIGALSHGCLLVCCYGSTRRTLVAEAAGTLSWYGATLLGVVLTRVPERRAVADGYHVRYPADDARKRKEGRATPGDADPFVPASPAQGDARPSPVSSPAAAESP